MARSRAVIEDTFSSLANVAAAASSCGRVCQIGGTVNCSTFDWSTPLSTVNFELSTFYDPHRAHLAELLIPRVEARRHVHHGDLIQRTFQRHVHQRRGLRRVGMSAPY